jgi:membrane protease YdiL (CAAX protease family)
MLHPIAGLPLGLPGTAVMIVVPALTATIMRYWEEGTPGILALWHVFDIDRVRSIRWGAIALLTMPAATLSSFVLMKLAGFPLPTPLSISVSEIAVAFILYFLGAILEEVGWTGYATEPLQQRFGVSNAGFVIGTVWAVWHIVPWAIIQGHPASWLIGQTVLTVLMRIVMGHIYAEGGKSLFLATLFHATINTSYSAFPNAGSHYDPLVLSIVLAAAMIAVAMLRRASYR